MDPNLREKLLLINEQGACRKHDPEFMFPSSGVGVIAAKKVCEICPLQATCLEYALEAKELFGVWGGTSQRERERIFRERKVA